MRAIAVRLFDVTYCWVLMLVVGDHSCQHCTRRVEIPRMHRHSHASRSSDDTEDSGLGLIRLEVHKNPVKQMLEFRVIDNGPGLGGFTEEQLLAWWDDGVVDSRGLPSLRPQSRPVSSSLLLVVFSRFCLLVRTACLCFRSRSLTAVHVWPSL